MIFNKNPSTGLHFIQFVRANNIWRLKDILNDYVLNHIRYKTQFFQPSGEQNKKTEQISLLGFRCYVWTFFVS